MIAKYDLPYAYKTMEINFLDEFSHALGSVDVNNVLTPGGASMMMLPTGNGFGASPAPTIAVARRGASPLFGTNTLQLTTSDANNEGTQLAWGSPSGGAGIVADGFGVGGQAQNATIDPPVVSFYGSIWGFRGAGSDHTGGAFAFGFGAHDATNGVLDTNGAATGVQGCYLRIVGSSTMQAVSVGSVATVTTNVSHSSVPLSENTPYFCGVKIVQRGTSATSVANSGVVEFYFGPTRNIVNVATHNLLSVGNMLAIAPIICGVRLTAAVIIEVANVPFAQSITYSF